MTAPATRSPAARCPRTFFTMAEGLVLPSMARTGLAFLHANLDVKHPTLVADTIYVRCEVVEARETSNVGRGLVRTRNVVTNASDEPLLVYQPLWLMRRRAVKGDG